MKFRPIRSLVEQEAACAVAKDDGHSLVAPSHIIEKDNYIIGSISVMPMAIVWLHSQKARQRDTLQVNDFLEGMLACQARIMCVPCTDTSPLFNLMTQLEYINLGKTNLFVKGI